jgi:hypothetical protein
MTDNEIAEKFIPKFTSEDTSKFTAAIEDLTAHARDANQLVNLPASLLESTLRVRIAETERMLASVKPTFLSNSQVDSFCSLNEKVCERAKNFVRAIKEEFQKTYPSYVDEPIGYFQGVIGLWMILCIVYPILLLLSEKERLRTFNTTELSAIFSSERLYVDMLLLGNAFLAIVGGSTLALIVLLGNRHKKKKALAAPYVFPDWMIEVEDQVRSISNRFTSNRDEYYEEVRSNRQLIEKVRGRLVDDYFDEKASKRSLAERIAIIEAEVRAATATAKTLEEQHLKTEEVRLKYAKELIDLQRQVKAEDNQDLTDKLQLLQSVLGDGA